MTFDSDTILSVLDRCCGRYMFPMLDNGYVYLAATRLSLYRSLADWALVIEVFGFSPRSDCPDTMIYTFASRLHERNRPEHYVKREAYERYLADNPHNEMRSAFPIEGGAWQDAEDVCLVASNAIEVVVRGQALRLPNLDEYERHGVSLERPPRVQVFELCRLLADVAPERVLATRQEQRISVMPEMSQLLQLEEWHHPNVRIDELPSESETFQQLAEVLATGDVEHYRPWRPPNTHWSNWPESGRL